MSVEFYKKRQEGEYLTVNANSRKSVEDFCGKAVKRHNKKETMAIRIEVWYRTMILFTRRKSMK